jgi:acetyl-CoA carboxylase biotin carboxyl carrier protein
MTLNLTQEDILDILQVFGRSEFGHLELVAGSVRIVVNRALPSAASSVDSVPDTVEIVAPLLGMFQAGPEPGAPAFVCPGTRVEAGTTVGIIRVLQDVTTVPAGLRGTVADVLVQDGQFVEFGQTLLRLRTELAAADSCRPGPNGASTR